MAWQPLVLEETSMDPALEFDQLPTSFPPPNYPRLSSKLITAKVEKRYYHTVLVLWGHF